MLVQKKTQKTPKKNVSEAQDGICVSRIEHRGGRLAAAPLVVVILCGVGRVGLVVVDSLGNMVVEGVVVMAVCVKTH